MSQFFIVFIKYNSTVRALIKCKQDSKKSFLKIEFFRKIECAHEVWSCHAKQNHNKQKYSLQFFDKNYFVFLPRNLTGEIFFIFFTKWKRNSVCKRSNTYNILYFYCGGDDVDGYFFVARHSGLDQKFTMVWTK